VRGQPSAARCRRRPRPAQAGQPRDRRRRLFPARVPEVPRPAGVAQSGRLRQARRSPPYCRQALTGRAKTTTLGRAAIRAGQFARKARMNLARSLRCPSAFPDRLARHIQFPRCTGTFRTSHCFRDHVVQRPGVPVRVGAVVDVGAVSRQYNGAFLCGKRTCQTKTFGRENVDFFGLYRYSTVGSPGLRPWPVLVALALLGAGCVGGGQPPVSGSPAGKAVHFSVVARGGPSVGGATAQTRNEVYLFAAPSIADLKGIVYASGDSLEPENCVKPPAPTECWNAAPAKSMMIATLAPRGCGFESDIADATLSGSTLTVTTVTKGTFCLLPGSGTQPTPGFWLVAVPLADLPSAILTVRVHGVAESGLALPPLMRRPPSTSEARPTNL